MNDLADLKLPDETLIEDLRKAETGTPLLDARVALALGWYCTITSEAISNQGGGYRTWARWFTPGGKEAPALFPLLTRVVHEALRLKPEGVILDMTVGTSGEAMAFIHDPATGYWETSVRASAHTLALAICSALVAWQRRAT